MNLMNARCLLLLVSLILGGCVNGPHGQSDQKSTESEEQRLQSRIAWLLLEAEEAALRQQLTTPEGDNALENYQAVLSLQSGNAEALRGLDRIVDSYLRWARQAASRGDTSKAQTYIDRARLVQPNSAKITAQQNKLDSLEVAELEPGEYAIDIRQLKGRDSSLASELGDIGKQVQQQGAVFLIVAPSDKDGRWIFQQMQEAATGRLRGNIEIGARARVKVLQKPKNS